jgi:hypothetical protein
VQNRIASVLDTSFCSAVEDTPLLTLRTPQQNDDGRPEDRPLSKNLSGEY